MRIFPRRSVACQEWVELVTGYLEGALPRRLETAIKRHLATCPHCVEYLAQMRRTIQLLGALPDDEEVPPEMLATLERAFEEYAGGR